MIVQQLHEIQHRYGYLPADELRALSDLTGTPLYRLEEVSSFFPHFRREQPPKVEVRICRDMACHLNGSRELRQSLDELSQQYKKEHLSVGGASCLGRCDRAPVCFIASQAGHDGHDEDFRVYANLTKEKLCDVVRQTVEAVTKPDHNGQKPLADSDVAWNPDQGQNWEIDVYRDKPDEERYAAVRWFVAHSAGLKMDLGDKPTKETNVALDPELERKISDPRDLGPRFLEERDPARRKIIASLYTAGLLGMGGAGGRAYKKWFDVREATGGEKYVVSNGDESEPGTFKDRELLLRAPHLVIEGVILAGLLLKAKHGYLYIRHEYPEQIAALRGEIERAEKLGVCGQGILGTDVSFPVEVFVSPGGYICGEQTALIEAMEGKRGEPRNRPPELQTNGLWDKPTLLNNIETLSWVPAILLKDDGKWFAAQGKKPFSGKRFISISGDVQRPGVYEIPFGTTLRELIEDCCGGMRDGHTFKAVAPSGPSGGFLPRTLPVSGLPRKFVEENLKGGGPDFDVFDMQFDVGMSRKMDIMMAPGVTVYGQQADIVDEALAALEFYRNESCGKCVPCRIGSQKLVDIATKLKQREYKLAQWYGDGGPMNQLVEELSQTMELTAICGLGTVASNPLTSLIKYFREDVEKYLT